MTSVVVFLVIAVFLEASFITLPITFISLLFIAVMTQKEEVFALAFFSGIFLDILTFHPIGLSSVYFLLFLLTVFLYRSKFEIKTLGFFALFGFIGSLGYLLINGSDYILPVSVAATLLGLISFQTFKFYSNKLSLI